MLPIEQKGKERSNFLYNKSIVLHFIFLTSFSHFLSVRRFDVQFLIDLGFQTNMFDKSNFKIRSVRIEKLIVKKKKFYWIFLVRYFTYCSRFFQTTNR